MYYFHPNYIKPIFALFSQPKILGMIQRIQTIYFIAIVIIATMSCTGELLNSMQMMPGMAKYYTLNAMYLCTYENGALVSTVIQYDTIVLVALIIGWTVNIIMGFKNRKRQMTHARINYIFISALIAVLFIKAFVVLPGFSMGSLSMRSAFGIALLVFMIYLNTRALMMIKKDEELVKSADRIR